MTEDNVEILDVVTRLDVPVSRVLSGAQEADLEGVVIVGYDKDGNEYFSSSYAAGDTCVWLLERAKLKLLTVEVDDP